MYCGRIQHAWLLLPGYGSIRWYLSCNGCIRIQLGCHERLSSFKHSWTMEESDICSSNNSLQRTRRNCWELYRSATRSSEIYDSNLGEHRISHRDHPDCCHSLP